MADIKITELQSNLLEEELNDADLSMIVGGSSCGDGSSSGSDPFDSVLRSLLDSLNSSISLPDQGVLDGGVLFAVRHLPIE